MIEFTKFGSRGEIVWLNPDLFVSIQARPDTVIVLTNGATVTVAQTPDAVVARIRTWRVATMAPAVGTRRLVPVWRA